MHCISAVVITSHKLAYSARLGVLVVGGIGWQSAGAPAPRFAPSRLGPVCLAPFDGLRAADQSPLGGNSRDQVRWLARALPIHRTATIDKPRFEFG